MKGFIKILIEHIDNNLKLIEVGRKKSLVTDKEYWEFEYRTKEVKKGIIELEEHQEALRRIMVSITERDEPI